MIKSLDELIHHSDHPVVKFMFSPSTNINGSSSIDNNMNNDKIKINPDDGNNGTKDEYENSIDKKTKDDDNNETWYNNTNLDSSQKEAVQFITNSSYPITLIHGPPGKYAHV